MDSDHSTVFAAVSSTDCWTVSPIHAASILLAGSFVGRPAAAAASSGQRQLQLAWKSKLFGIVNCDRLAVWPETYD